MHFKLCVFLYTIITPLKTLLTDSQEAKNIFIHFIFFIFRFSQLIFLSCHKRGYKSIVTALCH